MTENELSFEIIGAAIEVHRVLGPGFWNLLMKSVFAMNCNKRNFTSNSNFDYRCDIRISL